MKQVLIYFFTIIYYIYYLGSNGPECKLCKDDPKKNCRSCNCHICGIKQDPDKQLLCDECDMAYHIYCLNPPLTSIPEDEDWSVTVIHHFTILVYVLGMKFILRVLQVLSRLS